MDTAGLNDNHSPAIVQRSATSLYFLLVSSRKDGNVENKLPRGSKTSLTTKMFPSVGCEPSLLCGRVLPPAKGEQKKTWNFGGPSSGKLQAIPKRNRTTGSHQNIHPKSNSPSYILVKSSVSTVLNILVFLPRGFLTFPGKKRKNRDTSTTPLELSTGAILWNHPSAEYHPVGDFPPESEKLRKPRSKFTKGTQ